VKATCMNAVRNPTDDGPAWVHCGWKGMVDSITQECPKCLRAGALAPLIEVPVCG
jgi:hypothetical protein